MASNHKEMMIFLHHLDEKHNGAFDEHCMVCQMLAKPIRRENFDSKKKNNKHDYSSMNTQFTKANIRHYKNLNLFRYDDIEEQSKILSRTQLGIAFLSREEYSLSFIAYMTGLNISTINSFIVKMKQNDIFKDGYYPNDGLNNNNRFYRHIVEYVINNHKRSTFNFYDLLKLNVLTEEEINFIIQSNYDFYRVLNKTRINQNDQAKNISPSKLFQLKNNIQHHIPMNNTVAQLDIPKYVVKYFYNLSDCIELENAIIFQVFNTLFKFNTNRNKYEIKNKEWQSKIGYFALLLNTYLLKINNKNVFANNFSTIFKNNINRQKTKILMTYSLEKLISLIYDESVHLIQNYPYMFKNKYIKEAEWNPYNTLKYTFNLSDKILALH